uniref:J domain-containing protein n=1 Tax=Glycine max TaxID=3847 RepID=A0A368UJR5_SOYBN
MSSSAAVHLQSPINHSSDAPPPHSPFLYFNADCLNPSAAAAASAARTRSRPRLAKLRKQSASQQARSWSRTSATGHDGSGACAGFNPFRSDQVTTGNVNNSGVESGSDGFVFAAGKGGSDSARDLKGPSEGEIGKSGGVEFVFSAKKRSEDELKKKNENVAEAVSGEGRKVVLNSEGEQGESNTRELVFGACRNNLDSGLNTEKGKSGVPVGDPRFDNGGVRECKTELECGKRDCSANNVEKPEHVGSVWNSDCGMGAFGVKMGGNGNSDAGADRCDHLGDECESRNDSLNGIAATYCDVPVRNLSYGMEKLNIKHSEGADITRDSANSHANGSAGFVFGASDKVFGYSSVSSRTDADGQQSCAQATYENIGGQFAKVGGLNGVQNRTACGVARGSAGIHCSKPSTCQEGTRDFQCGKIPECNVSEDLKVNGAAASFSFSPFGFDSHTNNHASMGHSSSADNDKDRNCFASTPEASKESFADFKPPTWDPSCFKENLFPKLNKKVESTPKGRSCKEKGSKCMRKKMKPHSVNKKQSGLYHLSKENGSQKTPDSSGIHSPMDFSPYQETTASDRVKASEKLNDLHSTMPTDRSGSVAGASADAGFDFIPNTEKQKDDVFRFVHGVNDSKGKGFAFSASSSVDGTPSLKRQQKKKFRRKMGCNSFVNSPRVNGNFVSSVQFSPHNPANMSSHSDVQFKEGDVASLDTIPAACDTWRLRGNQAHKDGDLSKAEDLYSRGINSVPSSERSGCWAKPLLLCYSNRAATRMSLGRIREALEDCMMATALDPTFMKVQMRTANCHLLLGEVETAHQCFNKCMESGSVVCLDRRVIVEAAEGLQKAQEVVKCINYAAGLLKERTSDAAATALELVSKALSISLYSEKLLQMKAEALCLLQKYDAAIQLCEQSQHLAETNFVLANNTENSDSSLCDSYSSVKLWRWSLKSKCYFCLGRLEASLNVLEKLQQVVSVTDKCVVDNIEDLLTLASTTRELLKDKREGNENFKSGKYMEAVENYTSALSCNIKSRPFMAICFCNRAAAHQALDQIADAIADCSVAIALDGNYAKAISRRATLHEMVRDYEQAACDLKRLIAVLETQSNERAKQSDSPSGSNAVKELRQAHQRLLSVEDQAKKGAPLDVYLILGIKSADTATDIKKAYHKAALRHHPDKAGQLLARSEVGDEGQLWKEISQEVYKDADKLFKMIGEAYAVLSDPAKRSEYDLEEEIREASKLCNRELLTDEMDGIIGRPMDIHILDGKRILMSWASRFFCLVKVTFFLTHDGMKKRIKFAFAGHD